jgi:hypothetical protein
MTAHVRSLPIRDVRCYPKTPVERVSANSFRITTLGKEVDAELHMVFMGLWEPGEMVLILKERGLLAFAEAMQPCGFSAWLPGLCSDCVNSRG